MMQKKFIFITFMMLSLVLPIIFSEEIDSKLFPVAPEQFEQFSEFQLIVKNINKEPTAAEIEELKKEVNKFIDPAFLNIKKCPVALLIVTEPNTNKVKSVFIESVSKTCQKSISKYFFKYNKELEIEFKNLMLTKEYNEVLESSKKHIKEALKEKEEAEKIKEFGIKIKDNYNGLVADGLNTLDINIYIPEKIKYSKLIYSVSDFGSVKEDESQKNKGIIKLVYQPKHLLEPPYKIDKLAIKLLDNKDKIIKEDSKEITLLRPPVILVHGAWGRYEDLEPLKESLQDYFFNKRFCCKKPDIIKAVITRDFPFYYWGKENENCGEGSVDFVTKCFKYVGGEKNYKFQVVYNYDYESEDTEAVDVIAKDFKNYIGVVEKNLIYKNIKPGKVDIMAHSMGGLPVRYYISALDGYKKIRKFIGLGNPHLGAENFKLIWDLCPSVTADLSVPYCDAFLQAAAAAKGIFGNSNLFETGPFVQQLIPDSDFLNNLNNMPKYDNKIEYVFVTATKGLFSYFPERVLEIIPTAVGVADRFDAKLKLGDKKYMVGVNVPKEAIPFIEAFIESLSEEGYTDGFVDVNSAWAIKDNKKIIEGRHFSFPLDHLALALKPTLLPFFIQQLSGEENIIVSSGSPINIHAYDSLGNHIGISEDKIESEIPGAIFVEEDGHQFIYLPSNQTHSYMVKGTENGTFSLTFNEEKDGNYGILSYSNVSVSDKTKIEFKPSKSIIKSVLSIDENNDGITDNEIYPYSSFEGKIKKTEESQKTTKGIVYAPKRFSKLWLLLLIIPLAIIIFLIVRKKY